VLLHGFDSSLLEFRRLLPLLENAGVPAIAVDLVGCGFTGLQYPKKRSAAPDDRRDHLRAFLEQYAGSTQVDLLGASLGGTCAIDFTLAHPRLVRQIVLVDAQGFVEGTPQLPGPLADVGIRVLRAIWLRSMANVMAYSDTKKFATDDAMRVGRLHTHLPDWSRSTRSFMDSGGFRVAKRVREVHKKTLVVWGVDDEIISASVASRFAEELPNCEICYFPECGHVAHLERPHALRDAILRFRAENS
jgi:pimeloyl-ACP methyl ester carboxylesterase